MYTTTEQISATHAKKVIEKTISTDKRKLVEMVFYIQYSLPFSERLEKSDDGNRTLVFPPHSNLLPVVPVDAHVDPDSPLSVFHYWRTHIEPQLTEFQFMLTTFESLYREQRRFRTDYGMIFFRRQLSLRSVCKKLGYEIYEFPNHPALVYDNVCEDCGSVTPFHVLLDAPRCTVCLGIV